MTRDNFTYQKLEPASGGWYASVMFSARKEEQTLLEHKVPLSDQVSPSCQFLPCEP
jgi:hypothetical protein